MGFPPPYIALAAAVLAILPAAGLATMAQDPNNTKVMIITYVFMFGWLAIVLLFSAADWWALRKDIFKDKLHPLFTGFENKSNEEIEEVMTETVTDFSKRYGDHRLALITLSSWLFTIIFGIMMGICFYTGSPIYLVLAVGSAIILVVLFVFYLKKTRDKTKNRVTLMS